MNSEKITKRKKPRWWILKRIAMEIFGLVVVVNIVFCWLQEIFLMEPWKVSTGYVEMEELKPSNDRYLSPPNSLLPIVKEEWPPKNFSCL
jgi:hypothetical protein